MLLPSQVSVKKIQQFSGHAAGVFAIEKGTLPHTVLTGGGDGLVAEWDLKGEHAGKGLIRVSGNIFSLLLIPEMNYLIAGDLKGDVHLTDLVLKQEIINFSCDGAIVYDIKLMDNNTIGIGCENGFFYVWDLFLQKIIKKIHVAEKSIRHVLISEKRNEIIFSCSDNFIYVYDKHTLSHKHVLAAHTNSVFSSCFTMDEKILISGSRDAQLVIWDVENNYQLMKAIPAHMFTINDIKLSPNGRLFATAGRDKHIKIWETETFNLLKVIDNEKFAGHINSVNKLFWSNWNNYLISCGDDRSVIVWDITVNDSKGEELSLHAGG